MATKINYYKLLNEWKIRLGLYDWRIKLNIETDYENSGTSEWVECDKVAIIRIISKNSYGQRILEYDFERILVHELLHLKFSLLDDHNNELNYRVLHQIIDDLARALICAKRSIKTIGVKLK